MGAAAGALLVAPATILLRVVNVLNADPAVNLVYALGPVLTVLWLTPGGIAVSISWLFWIGAVAVAAAAALAQAPALGLFDRRRSRCVEGSRRYRERSRELGALHARARNIRSNCLHHITTDLAKSHGTIVVEGAVWSALAQQKHLLGARTRRRQLHDAAPGEIRRQLGYKTRWYGSQLIVADKFYPSSKTCPSCGHVQNIGWAAKWTCAQCETVHDRDDAAAVNLAAYPQRGNAARCECGCGRSPVGASVKRSPKARPEPATTPLGNGAGTGDEPKTATAPSDAERFTRSGNATGRAGRQGHANQGTPNQRGVSGTPRRGTRIKASTNA